MAIHFGRIGYAEVYAPGEDGEDLLVLHCDGPKWQDSPGPKLARALRSHFGETTAAEGNAEQGGAANAGPEMKPGDPPAASQAGQAGPDSGRSLEGLRRRLQSALLSLLDEERSSIVAVLDEKREDSRVNGWFAAPKRGEGSGADLEDQDQSGKIELPETEEAPRENERFADSSRGEEGAAPAKKRSGNFEFEEMRGEIEVNRELRVDELSEGSLASILGLDGAHVIDREGRLVAVGLRILGGDKTPNNVGGTGHSALRVMELAEEFKGALLIKVSAGGTITVLEGKGPQET